MAQLAEKSKNTQLEEFGKFLEDADDIFYKSDVYASDGSTFYDKNIEEVWAEPLSAI